MQEEFTNDSKFKKNKYYKLNFIRYFVTRIKIQGKNLKLIFANDSKFKKNKYYKLNFIKYFVIRSKIQEKNLKFIRFFLIH